MSAGDSAGGRDLVEERLEEVVVRAVDERDVDRGAAQGARGDEPAEAAAHDHDVRPGVHPPL